MTDRASECALVEHGRLVSRMIIGGTGPPAPWPTADLSVITLDESGIGEGWWTLSAPELVQARTGNGMGTPANA